MQQKTLFKFGVKQKMMKKIGDILTDVEINSNLPLSKAPIKQNVKGIKNMDKLIDKYLNIHKEIQEAVNSGYPTC